ncbi:MAG: hypothetical protein ABIQ63_08785, partial [Rhodanobacter sp.]
GLLGGMAVGGVAGWLAEHVMRRLGVNTATTLVVATLACLCAVWQVAGLVLGGYPGMRAPIAHPTTSATALPRSPCASPAPSDAMARKSWEAECH